MFQGIVKNFMNFHIKFKIQMSYYTFVQISFACLLGAMLPGPSMVIVLNKLFLKIGIMVF